MTVSCAIPLPILDDGPQRPVHALGPRSLAAVRMLRISLTDRCNLRCRYCMPEEGVAFEPKEKLLDVDSIDRIARVAHGFGVRHFKLTGGEPTLRPDLLEVIRNLRRLPEVDISMTTNGTRLSRMAESLRSAGLDRLTISIDSLRPDRYRHITGGGRLGPVLEGFEASSAIFPAPKLNVVVMRGVNHDELSDFARFAMRHDSTVRFIEFMPLGHSPLADADPEAVLFTAEEIVSEIEDSLGTLVDLDSAVDPGIGPARLMAIPGGRGRIGLIHAMSRPFCESCNRLRLTATGTLRSCLFDGGEVELAPLVASDDAVIRGAFASCAAFKPEVHRGRGERAMSSIGG